MMNQARGMATKKKAKSKPRSKVKLKVKAKAAPKKKAAKKVTKKKQAAPAPVDVGSTQQIAIAEIMGDIEERMALDRLSATVE